MLGHALIPRDVMSIQCNYHIYNRYIISSCIIRDIASWLKHFNRCVLLRFHRSWRAFLDKNTHAYVFMYK